ncbi:MAG: cell division protein ZapE, partial [Gammaproteobacteria bacterium]|nr:cell division protein ZapE [Gammaproteobacteria bacterium]
FAEGICLVATSNCAPKDLYRDGLKRDVFLPAIHLIESFTEVVNVESGIDYREQTEITATRYYTPLAGQETFMQAHFEKARGQEALLPNQFEICDRTIQAVKRTAGVVWFEFEEICKEPRAKADYIALADQYHTVLVSNIPQMDESRDDYCKRFIALVDELYDNNINLIVSAQVPAEALYTGKRNAFAFKRTVSRLA